MIHRKYKKKIKQGKTRKRQKIWHEQKLNKGLASLNLPTVMVRKESTEQVTPLFVVDRLAHSTNWIGTWVIG